MRVIGGIWGGRALEAPEGRDVTRPTTDRVREAMASMVLSAFDLDLSGARVLDAFAGSGALGIEMLSRGAAHATFVDADRRAAARVRRNLEAVGADLSQADVLAQDAFRLARGEIPGAPFSLVLLDPPYGLPQGEVSGLVAGLSEGGQLAEGAYVLYERGASGEPLAVEGATMVRQRRFGTTGVDLARIDRR